jgi:hypothetical protein
MKLQLFFKKKSISIPLVFGNPDNGSHDNPWMNKGSVHYFLKYVSGKKLQRPWFFDVNQQGEGMTDITTHLADLVK